MLDVGVSEPLVEAMLSDFEVLAAACRAEVEGTATPQVVAALHSPRLRQARADGLHYVQTLFEGDMHVSGLTRQNRRRTAACTAFMRAQALRVEATAELRAERARRHRSGDWRDFDAMCGWLVKQLLPEEYSRTFESVMITEGGAPERGRLPARDWWAWGVEHGWLTATPSPDSRRLLTLDEHAFVEAVRRSLTVEYIPGLDEPPVVERWERALSAVEDDVRADIREVLTIHRTLQVAHQEDLDRLRALFEEFAVLRVHRSAARRAYNEFRDNVASAVTAAQVAIVRRCHARAAAALAEAYPAVWRRAREVVTEHRDVWERDDFDFSTSSELAAEWVAAVAVDAPSTVPAEPGSDHDVMPARTAEALEVAVDASGFGATGGYGWAAADGRFGGGRCTGGISATESEVIAICEAALEPELAGRPLRIVSDCVGAVDAVNAALIRGAVGRFPYSESARDRLRSAIGRPVPFTVRWVASRSGNRLHDHAHRLSRARRFR